MYDHEVLNRTVFTFLQMEDLSESEKYFLAKNNIKKIFGFMWSLFSEIPDMQFFTSQVSISRILFMRTIPKSWTVLNM